ncbi:MBL fold metallo-hydrolase [Nocardioides sp. R-C-SC26]|uniref:MBL fold metallo-hydrolase n=1 Tax=Nocardioides sp. R-C-SC26 TaxID=2870414 RepID=UPI001E4B45C4|nr:MBL fold metallo-hydrolase [Nocardioides sp. R-C-SC26]
MPLDVEHAAAHQRREIPAPSDLGHGITAIPVPLAGSPLRSVMAHAIEPSAGLVLVDAAYRHPSCWDAAVAALATRGQRVEDVAAVLITHNHPDHVGFAERVRQVSGAEIVIHAGDDFARQAATRGGFLEQLQNALVASGAPDDVVSAMYDAAVTVAVHDESLVADRVIDGVTDLRYGDTVITALPTAGHTYGHVCFGHQDGVLFTGDTLMPEGQVQLAIASRPDDDPIGDLLASLDAIASFGASVAAPAHQYPYLDPGARARVLRDHHARELAQVASLARDHETAWEIAPHLSWPKPWSEMGLGTQRFALMHTAALLRGVPARSASG